MTPHNEAKCEDIAKIVLMPGDPIRAKKIAEDFLTDYKLVNGVRGMFAYTGYYQDKRITVMASGMGNASMGIYSYELYNDYDVDYIIRIGTAGSFNSNLQLRDILLVDSTYSDSSYAKIAYNFDDNIVLSSVSLNNLLTLKANELNVNIKTGRVYSTDVFYAKTNANDIAIKNNCLSVEMETWALFNNAKYFKKEATALLTITDTFYSDEKLSALERQNNFNNVVKLALETVKNI